MVIIVMGVSGCGKTTIGAMLAKALNCPFTDADDFHSAASRAKMADGIPLTDADRAPWLAELRSMIENAQSKSGNHVFACSALKNKYRRALDPQGACRLIYLRGDPLQLAQRLAEREGHFFNPILLESQLDALEEPINAMILDIGPPPDILVNCLLPLLAPQRI